MNNIVTPQFHKIPITLGITGHRDLREEDKEILRNSVRKIFQFIHTNYPNTPLQLFSPLADGADRLVAEVALAENVQLLVPLPMPKELYEIDFQTPDSKQEFEQLLEKAQVFELPLLEGNTTETVRDYGDARTLQYALVGAYIARHSHILIALWDGIPLDKSGGTSQVVQFKRTGDMMDLPKCYKPQQHGPLDVPDTGPICQVVTGRESGEPLDLVGEFKVLLPNNEDKNHLEDLLSSDLAAINRFNHDVTKHVNCFLLQRRIINGQKYLLSEKRWQDLLTLSPAFQTMLGVHSTANTLARFFQNRLRRSSIKVLWLTAAMVGLYGWYSNLENNPTILIGYLMLFLSAAGLGWIAKGRHYQSKRLDYRALAGGLRVQLFWHLGGLSDSVADYYLCKQRGELTWIQSAIRALNIHDWVENQENLETIHQKWIVHQREWFSKHAQRNQRKAKKWGWWKKGFFTLGVVSIVGLLVGQFTGTLQSGEMWHNLLILLIALAPTAGALLHHYTEKMAFDEHAKQYERMVALFSRASDELKNIMTRLQQVKDDPIASEACQKAAKELLFELGKEVLENGDWVLFHRKIPLELPKMG
ncbi:MAG TPA: hypothetical protein ENG03_02765 [Thioploca sp.]|nr:MAG: hypothetical protein DRR19_10825 [Gammaproteobacteria bacterium]HDN26018.1 hypothetical protein [Thioploca sp.]